MRNFILVAVSILFVQGARSQTISYLTPDAAAPGMCVVVEFIGPNLQGNFGTDGLNQSEIRFVNPSDTERLVVGPLVTSWDGRMVSAMIFVKDSAMTGPIPLQVSVFGRPSNTDTFYIVAPQHIGALTWTGSLGSGGRSGVRTRRNVMVVDSLIVGPGPTTISSIDPDLNTVGNQAFLPFTLLSKGPVRIMGPLSASASALDAIAGGGGGGGGRPIVGGNGFTGGGGTERVGGVGSGGTSDASNQGGQSLNAVAGGIGCVPDDQGGGGGTGFPFGTSGSNGTWYAVGGVSKPGGYGGGSAGGEHSNLDTSYGGGGGGFATDGTTGSFNGDNHGHSYGNPMIVPFCGGSGGGAANTYGQGSPGSGGGGGGAINLVSYDEMEIWAPIRADGANGGNSLTGYAGGGGAGSGGSIELTGQDLIFVNDSLSAIGGQGGDAVYLLDGGGMRGGDGGGGAIRINGQVITSGVSVKDGSSYIGPTVKKCLLINPESSTILGTGQPGDSIYIFYRSDNQPWNYSTPLKSIVRPDSTWEYFIGFTPRNLKYIATLQKDRLVVDLIHYQPEWVMSHTSGAIVCKTVVSSVSSDSPKGQRLLVTVSTDGSHLSSARLFVAGAVGDTKVELYNLLGECFDKQSLMVQDDVTITFPQAALHPGVYIYRVEASGQVVSGKFVILK